MIETRGKQMHDIFCNKQVAVHYNSATYKNTPKSRMIVTPLDCIIVMLLSSISLSVCPTTCMQQGDAILGLGLYLKRPQHLIHPYLQCD